MTSNSHATQAERGPFHWDHDGREAVFVERLRALRELNGWSQSELARRAQEAGLAFHQQTVDKIERGRRPLKLSEALTLSTLFGIQLETSLGDPRIATLLHAVLRAEHFLRCAKEHVFAGEVDLARLALDAAQVQMDTEVSS